jgi:hypothetical protein
MIYVIQEGRDIDLEVYCCGGEHECVESLTPEAAELLASQLRAAIKRVQEYPGVRGDA